MSEKQVSGKSFTNSNAFQKKQSTKYLKRNSSFNDHSVTSMIQSHLENSNKFLVGSKKQ